MPITLVNVNLIKAVNHIKIWVENNLGVFILSVLSCSAISIFLPYFVLDGLSIGSLVIDLDYYEKFAVFIAGITAPFLSLATIILIFQTYRSQKAELNATKSELRNQSIIARLDSILTQLNYQRDNLINSKVITQSQIFDRVIDRVREKIEENYNKPPQGTTSAFRNLYSFANEGFTVDVWRTSYRTYIESYVRLLSELLNFLNDEAPHLKKQVASYLSLNERLIIYYYAQSNVGQHLRSLIFNSKIIQSIDPLEKLEFNVKPNRNRLLQGQSKNALINIKHDISFYLALDIRENKLKTTGTTDLRSFADYKINRTVKRERDLIIIFEFEIHKEKFNEKYSDRAEGYNLAAFEKDVQDFMSHVIESVIFYDSFWIINQFDFKVSNHLIERDLQSEYDKVSVSLACLKNQLPAELLMQ